MDKKQISVRESWAFSGSGEQVPTPSASFQFHYARLIFNHLL